VGSGFLTSHAKGVKGMNLGYGPKEIEQADPDNTKGRPCCWLGVEISKLVAKVRVPKIKLTLRTLRNVTQSRSTQPRNSSRICVQVIDEDKRS
jgi:hypothetical protein